MAKDERNRKPETIYKCYQYTTGIWGVQLNEIIHDSPETAQKQLKSGICRVFEMTPDGHRELTAMDIKSTAKYVAKAKS